MKYSQRKKARRQTAGKEQRNDSGKKKELGRKRDRQETPDRGKPEPSRRAVGKMGVSQPRPSGLDGYKIIHKKCLETAKILQY